MNFFKGPHTWERIAKFTLDICNYWQITNKVVRIGTDNGANMIKAFADFSDELQLDDIDLVVHNNDSEGNKDFDEIHPSILLEAVDNITQELAGSFHDSLLVRLRRNGLLQMWFPCVCHTAQLGVKDFLETNLGHRGQINAIVAKAQCFVTKCNKFRHFYHRKWHFG